jgi:hypothetical protein
MSDESNTAPQAGQEYARDDEVAEVAGIDWDHAEQRPFDCWRAALPIVLTVSRHHPSYLVAIKDFLSVREPN